jgi:prephenate dehydratase
LVKPGADVAEIADVLGHTGSITQTRSWIEAHLPYARITIVDTSSMDAAQRVAEGDGTIASIGTTAMAAQFGLDERVKDVDGGSVGSYWAVSPTPLFNENPTRVVVAGRFDDDGRLGDVIGNVIAAGFRLESVIPLASSERLFEYDVVVRFRGAGALRAVRSAVEAVPGARLAGAFIAKDE